MFLSSFLLFIFLSIISINDSPKFMANCFNSRSKSLSYKLNIFVFINSFALFVNSFFSLELKGFEKSFAPSKILFEVSTLNSSKKFIALSVCLE